MGNLWEIKEERREYSAANFSIAATFGAKKANIVSYVRKYETLNAMQLHQLLMDAKENRWEVLDLSDTGIVDFPEELWELENLKVLFVGNDRSRNIGEDINQIKIIPDEILKLQNLEALSICGLKNIKITNKLRDLPKLRYIDCFGCQFQIFPSGLKNTRITGIGIDCENEKVLENICSYRNLKELFLTNSKVKELPDKICNCKKLRRISIVGSQVAKIPNDMYKMVKISEFWIGDSELGKLVPEEIQKQSANELISYICHQQTERNQCYCNESKMIVVGQGNVGKTCLVERITENNYEEKKSTEGIAIKKWSYTYRKNQKYTLNIWDFGGQEIYHSTHQFFLTKRSLYVFVWDARAEEEYGRIDYWLKTIESFAADSPIIIAINKCDETTTRVNRIDFTYYSERYPQIKRIIDISCKDNIGIRSLKNQIKREASKLPIMQVPWLRKWYQVRMKLEELSSTKKYISYAEYRTICHSLGLEDGEMKSLSKYLHDLGIILHYEDDIKLCGIIILSPEWATGAVYKILDSQETVLKNKNGVLELKVLPEIWNDSELYPKETYSFLLKIMEKFQLCFEIDEERILVAELLENTSLPIPTGWDYNEAETIRLVYKYGFMPAGVMTRFIVAAHKYLVKSGGKWLCWKKGAYLRYGNAYASVIMTDSISEKKIEVKVYRKNNSSDGRELLSIIRHTLKEINDMFNKLEVEEYVPCNCSPKCPFQFPHKVLSNALEKKRGTVECHESFMPVNVMELLEGIETIKSEGESMYNQKIEVSPVINVNASSKALQNQVVNIENIQNDLVEIQGILNELKGLKEVDSEKELQEELVSVTQALEELEEAQSSREIVKTGKLQKVKRLIEGFSDEEGKYKKLYSGSKNIIKIIAELVKKYNTLAGLLNIAAIPFP